MAKVIDLCWRRILKCSDAVFVFSLYLQTVDLLGLLKWQKILSENDTTSLKKHLEHLMRVDGEEIVKVDTCVLWVFL